MSRNYYSEINLHVTWHCKDSLPLLTPQVEHLAHRCVKQKIINTPGAFLHEIGGTETHVHVAVTVPPTLTISEFVGQILEWVKQYIRSQREHHASGKVHDRLERITQPQP